MTTNITLMWLAYETLYLAGPAYRSAKVSYGAGWNVGWAEAVDPERSSSLPALHIELGPHRWWAWLGAEEASEALRWLLRDTAQPTEGTA